MALEDRKPWVETHRDLPGTAYSEAQPVPVRGTKRGEIYTYGLQKGTVGLADEGSYFIGTNPTPGTGIAGVAAADGYDATEALFYIRNGNSGDNAKRVYLDYLKLQVTVAGTNGTNVRYATHLDTGTDRHSSGGSSITPVCPNMDSDASSNAHFDFGALVMAAASSDVRQVGTGLIRNVIAVVGDEYLFDFGGHAVPGGALAVSGTAIAIRHIHHAPVVLGPTDMFILSLFAASQTVASQFEFEIGYWER